MKRIHPLITLPFVVAACTNVGDAPSTRADLAEVTRGELVVSVTESGEIKAAKSTLVKNEMEGNSTIIQLIEEGSIVHKGELLVELDASGQIERRATQEIAVEKAKAAVVNARKNLEILRKQVDSDTRAAMNTWDFAKMDKRKFYGEVLANGQREMGEQVQSIKAEEAQIDLARSELSLAKDRFTWSKKLRAKDFITKNDLDRDRLDYESKQTTLTLAINKLVILKKYTHEKTRRELDQAEAVAKLEYDRTIAKGEAEITQTVADLNAKVKEDELAAERLLNLEKQIKSARVLAPTQGIVVYASEGDRWRRRTIEIGTQVRERQSLIVLPDTSVMHAELKIQEVMIDKIRPGLPAEIKIDTSNAPLRGHVLRRAPLPDSGSRGVNPDLKEYKTTVRIDGQNEKGVLRPNMSATVKIIIDRLKDVLSVPQQAINSQGAVNFVWLHTPSGPVATVVKTGAHNEARVVITAGLEAKQLVYLVEPEGAKAPKFPQPENAKRDVEVPPNVVAEAAPKTSPKRPPGGQRSGGNPMSGPAMTAYRKAADDLKAAVKASNPDLHMKIEAAGRRWAMDPTIKSALEADASLSGAYATYQAAFEKLRSSFPGTGRGRRGGRGSGERGRNRGGERRPRSHGDNGGDN